MRRIFNAIKKTIPCYKWIIVAVCFLIEFLALGFCSGTKKLFLGPITAALGFERSLFGFNDTCRYVFTASIALFFGPLVKRFGTKKLILFGFPSLILSMTCYAVANSILVFYVGGCLLGIGLGLTTSTMVTAIIRAWCKGPHTGMMLQDASGVDKAHMIDVGLSEAFVTGILSIGSLILTCGKFLTGACYDRFGLRISMLVCDVLAVLAMLTLAITTPSSTGMIFALIHCVFSPLALPLETVMLSLITNDMFGDASFKVLGIVTAVNYAGFAVCSPLVNLCYDIFGTYVPVLYAFAIMMAVVAFIFQFAITAAHKDRPAVAAQ